MCQGGRGDRFEISRGIQVRTTGVGLSLGEEDSVTLEGLGVRGKEERGRELMNVDTTNH